MLRVLLVEDNHIIGEEFKKSLYDRFPSMVVEEAANGEEAFRKIKGVLPYLIFMDIRLPGQNGLKLTQKIKGDFPSVNVAILTSYDLPEYRQAAIQCGADCFFVKSSFNWDEVNAFVKSISPGGS